MMHFADRLVERVAGKGAACVGVDPVLDRLPDDVRQAGGPVEAIGRFCEVVLETVAPHVAVVKFQSACFERYAAAGVDCLNGLLVRAHELGLMTILDAKRGDIGSSAEHYAAACLAEADATTINAWCGSDGIRPFVDVAAEHGKGLFAWVRASNPSSDAVQGQKLADGRTVAEAMAELVAHIGGEKRCIGQSGYSLLGAVVGATKPDEAAQLRQLMPQQVFLVPGFGALEAGAEDVKACFAADGRGAIVNASRSILYAYQQTDAADWRAAIEQAALDMQQQLANALSV